MAAPSSPSPGPPSLCGSGAATLMEGHSLREVNMSSPVISAPGQPLKIRGHKRLYLKNVALGFFFQSEYWISSLDSLAVSLKFVALDLDQIPCLVFRVPAVLYLCPPTEEV